jgi:outer membrane protein, multidrug efflux system
VKRILATLTFAGIGAATLPAFAQVPAPTPEAPTTDQSSPSSTSSDVPELSFDQAIAIARKNNRTIRIDRAQLAAAQTATETAWSSLLPNISAQGKYTRNYTKVEFPAGAFGPTPFLLQPLNQWDGVVSGTLPLLAPAAWAALKSVDANVASAEANFEAQEAQLLVQVGDAFLVCAGDDELVEARESSLSVAQATLRDAQVRISAGTVTKVDVDRAQYEVVRAQQALLETQSSRATRYRTLATLLQTNHPFKVSTRFPTAAAPDPNDVKTALNLRPEFRALEQSAQSAEKESDARAWLWAPSISAFGNARRFNYDNFHLDRYSWAAGAELDWLLYDGGSRDAARHQANARAAAAREQAAMFGDRVRDDLINSSADLSVKQKAVQASQEALQLSSESLDLIRTQYTAGTATQLDLLQAQNAVVAARLALVQARFDVAAADLALRYSAGTFPPK